MGEARRRREAAKVMLEDGTRLFNNHPTPQGRKLGTLLADMADVGELLVRSEFPLSSPRCKSCAFTRGTFPNGCPETCIDLFGCLVEDEVFFCHEHFDDNGSPTSICAGWEFARHSGKAKIIRLALDGKMPSEMPARSAGAKAYLREHRAKFQRRKERA